MKKNKFLLQYKQGKPFLINELISMLHNGWDDVKFSRYKSEEDYEHHVFTVIRCIEDAYHDRYFKFTCHDKDGKTQYEQPIEVRLYDSVEIVEKYEPIH